MNKPENLKLEKECLEIRKDLSRFAEEGWETIGEDDLQRLKWVGLFLRKPTPGYFMLRVRIPNGFAYSHQIKTLADIAGTFGNGSLDITTRQQIQVRHLRIEHVPEVFDRMASVGLTSLQTGMDNVRNIMGCPVSGLQSVELIDGSPFVSALTQHILDNPEFTNLPRKFNVVISGCPHNCVEAETQDLALIPARREIQGQDVVGFNVLAGGKLGSGGYRIASPLNVFAAPEEVVEVCSEIILLYRDHGNRELRTANRLAFLLDDWGVDRFRKELVMRLGRPLTAAGTDLREMKKNDHVGIYRQKQFGVNYVGLKVVTGRITAAQFHETACLAERYGTGEIRLTPAQNIILPNVHDKRLGDLLEEPLLKELRYAPTGLTRHLVSCVGSDYCHLAAIETKTRAREVAEKMETLLDRVEPLSMHWSGCPAGCGNHLVADVGLLGKRAKVDGKVVDAVDIFVGGRTGPHPKLATRIMENVPCDILPNVLSQIIPYHTREKMHPVREKRRGQTRGGVDKRVPILSQQEFTGKPAAIPETQSLGNENV
ncbi:MAG: ferredoxin--nitrite reductase [Nitrospinaceae bacterium]